MKSGGSEFSSIRGLCAIRGSLDFGFWILDLRFFNRRWTQMDADGHRWTQMDADGRRWTQMDADEEPAAS